MFPIIPLFSYATNCLQTITGYMHQMAKLSGESQLISSQLSDNYYGWKYPYTFFRILKPVIIIRRSWLQCWQILFGDCSLLGCACTKFCHPWPILSKLNFFISEITFTFIESIIRVCNFLGWGEIQWCRCIGYH